MEFNKYLDLNEVSKVLGEELKTVSKTWAEQTINKIKKEKQIEKSVEPTLAELTKYNEMFAKAEKMNQKKREFYFKTISAEDNKIFAKVIAYKEDEKTLKQMEDNLKEYEEFLEIETNFKAEIDKQLTK
jgi:hydroxymethylpyrimidine pyrophosphatase-like HAD family hydrolase